MKFGLFGSAQAQRGGADLDSGAGLPRLHRLQCRGRGARLCVELRGRASLHRLRAGIGEPQSAHLGGGAHLDPAARHRRDGAAVAQSGAARRSRPRPSTCSPAGGSNSASARAIATTSSRASAFRWRRPRSASRNRSRVILKAWTSNERFSHHGKFWNFENIVVEPPTQAEAASADLDGGGPAGLDPQGGAARRQAAARPVRLDRADDRALQHLQGRGGGAGPALRSDGCRRVPRVLCGEGCRRQAEGGRGAARQPAAHVEARGPGRHRQILDAVVRPHARCGGGKRDVRHAGRDRARSSTRCRRPASRRCCSTARPDR